MEIMFTVMKSGRLNISVTTMEMPMFTSWKSKALSGKIESEGDSMDNLTAQKKLKLISDCIAAKDSIGKWHIDIKKMYSYLAVQAVNAETSSDIKDLEIAKVSLDFLVKGVLK